MEQTKNVYKTLNSSGINHQICKTEFIHKELLKSITLKFGVDQKCAPKNLGNKSFSVRKDDKNDYKC